MNDKQLPLIDHDQPSRLESRFETVSRRAFLRRAAQVAGAAAVFPLISACSGDEAVFDAAAASTVATTAAPAATSAAVTTAAPTSTTQPAATTSTASETLAGALPAGEMSIAFSYAASSSFGVRNPYVAVWIEDADGELVDTVALWFLQSRKGLRWLSDLRRWYSVDGSDDSIDTLSSATRTPGDYNLVWDVTDHNGNPLAAGEYYVCIEAAREHGPYSLIRESVMLTTESTQVALTDDGELANASVALRVA